MVIQMVTRRRVALTVAVASVAIALGILTAALAPSVIAINSNSVVISSLQVLGVPGSVLEGDSTLLRVSFPNGTVVACSVDFRIVFDNSSSATTSNSSGVFGGIENFSVIITPLPPWNCTRSL